MSTLHSQPSRIGISNRVKGLVLSGAILTLGTLGGCDNAGEGLFTGAALGAVTGLAIGSLDGNAGQGAALGAIIGGAGGAIIGDQNQRNRQNAQYQSYEYHNQSRYRSTSAPYCPTHRVYHTHRSYSDHHSSGGHHDEWWND